MSRIEADDGLFLEANVMYKAHDAEFYVDIGNVTELTFSTDGAETKDRISRQKGTSGNALDTINIPGKTVFSLTFDTFRKMNLAMAVMGTDTEANTEPATFTDKAFKVIALDQFIPIGKRNIEPNSVVVKNAAGTVLDSSLVEVYPKLGLIKIRTKNKTETKESKINKGDDVKLSFKTLGKDGYLINAATVSSFKGELLLDVKNLVNGKEFTVEAGNVTFAAEGGINWVGEDFGSATLKGTAALVEGKNTPYTIHGEYKNA